MLKLTYRHERLLEPGDPGSGSVVDLGLKRFASLCQRLRRKAAEDCRSPRRCRVVIKSPAGGRGLCRKAAEDCRSPRRWRAVVKSPARGSGAVSESGRGLPQSKTLARRKTALGSGARSLRVNGAPSQQSCRQTICWYSLSDALLLRKVMQLLIKSCPKPNQ